MLTTRVLASIRLRVNFGARHNVCVLRSQVTPRPVSELKGTVLPAQTNASPIPQAYQARASVIPDRHDDVQQTAPRKKATAQPQGPSVVCSCHPNTQLTSNLFQSRQCAIAPRSRNACKSPQSFPRKQAYKIAWLAQCLTAPLQPPPALIRQPSTPNAPPHQCIAHLQEASALGAPYMPHRNELAKAMGLTSGCLTASNVVKWGTMSLPLKRMNAP